MQSINIKVISAVSICLLIAVITYSVFFSGVSEKPVYDLISEFKNAALTGFDEKTPLSRFHSNEMFKLKIKKLVRASGVLFTGSERQSIHDYRFEKVLFRETGNIGIRLFIKETKPGNTIIIKSANSDQTHIQRIIVSTETRDILFKYEIIKNGETSTIREVRYPRHIPAGLTLNYIRIGDNLLLHTGDDIIFQSSIMPQGELEKVSINLESPGSNDTRIVIKTTTFSDEKALDYFQKAGANLNDLPGHFYTYGDLPWNEFYHSSELRHAKGLSKYLRRLKLGDTARPSIYIPQNCSVKYNLLLPVEPSLRFGIALSEFKQARLENLIFSVRIKNLKTEKTEKFEYPLSKYETIRETFVDFEIDLLAFSKSNVELEFSFRNTESTNSAALFALASPSIIPGRNNSQFNIILISLDTLRADHLSCYGNKRETSPNIDAFAASNTLYLNCASTSNWTLPSHMSIFSGLYPGETGFIRGLPSSHGMDFNYDVKTLSQYLKDCGFETCGIHEGGFVAPEFGFDKGFDKYISSSMDSEKTFNKAIDYIESVKDKKFFLFLHTYEVHGPYTRQHFINDADKKQMNLKERTIAKYDSCIHFVDNQVGRLLNYLEENNLTENTLIIITSDHGENFNYDFKGVPGTHGYTLKDSETHVPLLIGGINKFKTGKIIKSQTSTVDIVPTILNLLGIEPERELRGQPLDVLLNQEPSGKRLAYSEATQTVVPEKKSLRTLDYKLIATVAEEEKSTEDFTFELFDLKKDPGEGKNIAVDKTDILSGYSQMLRKIIISIRDNLKYAQPVNRGKRQASDALSEQLRAIGYLN